MKNLAAEHRAKCSFTHLGPVNSASRPLVQATDLFYERYRVRLERVAGRQQAGGSPQGPRLTRRAYSPPRS